MSDLEQELKVLIVDALNLEDISPEDIKSEEPLFGDGLGLDSIDALELGIALRKAYGLRIAVVNEDIKAHFASISSLAKFIASQKELSE